MFNAELLKSRLSQYGAAWLIAFLVCGVVLSVFDTLVPFQYNEQDRRAGYFFGKDRQHRILVRGETRWMRVRTQPLVSTDGIVMGHVGSVLDTSEQFCIQVDCVAVSRKLRSQLLFDLVDGFIGVCAGLVVED